MRRSLLLHLAGVLLLAAGACFLVLAVAMPGPRLAPGPALWAGAALCLLGGAGAVALGLRGAVVAMLHVARGELREEFCVALESQGGSQDTASRRALFDRYFRLNPHLEGAFATPAQAERRDALLHATRGPLALEIGCATGGIVQYLRDHGIQCAGLDLSIEQLRHALGPGPYVQGDAYRLPFRDSAFSTVLIPETLEHLHVPAVALAEAARVASERVVLSIPLAAEAGGASFHDPTHVRSYDVEAVRRLVGEVPALSIEEETPVSHGEFLVVACRVTRPALDT